MQTSIDLCDGCGGSSGSGAIVDSTNRRLNYGLSDHHTGHRAVFSGFYELPFGKGRAHLTSGAGAAILGGWAMSGIGTFSGGIPYTVTLNFDNANTGSTNWPNRIANGSLENPSVDRWFDTAAFVFPAAFTHGNAGRNILTGPGVVSFDASMQRNFGLPFISEASRLEFRAEAFNVANTPQLGQPNAAVGNPAYGTIGATARSNRQMQLGLRLVF